MTHVVSYAGGAAGVEEVYRVEADVDILAVQVHFNTKFAATHVIYRVFLALACSDHIENNYLEG